MSGLEMDAMQATDSTIERAKENLAKAQTELDELKAKVEEKVAGMRIR